MAECHREEAGDLSINLKCHEKRLPGDIRMLLGVLSEETKIMLCTLKNMVATIWRIR
jgi:hypothetical protein